MGGSRMVVVLGLSLVVVALGKGQEPKHVPVQVPVQPTGKQHTLTPSCPDGYYLESGKCVSKQEVPEAHTCPAGTTERHGQCLQFTAARYQCEGGLTLQGEDCVGVEVAEKIHQCPSGSTQVGKECVIHISKVPVCPAGTAAVGDRCARIAPMTKGCPSGYNPRGDLCAAQEYEELMTVCPNGTYEENGVCKTITSEVEECPEGTHDVGNGRCATYTSKLSECPKGYSRAGSHCLRTESVAKRVECPNGANPDNGCLQRVPIPLSPVCKVGKLVNGQCFKPRRLPVQYSCPEGYTLKSGSTCVKTVPYDCSQTHHDIECEQTPTSKSEANVRHRMLGVDNKGKYQNVNYSKRRGAAPLPVCHKVPRTTQKTCEKQLTAQADSVCGQAGAVFKGSYCEIDEFFAPDYKCDAQTDGKGDNCYAEERTAVIRACPDGYTNTGSQCSRTETIQPVFYCPPGTEEPSCATYVPKRCPHGDCSQQHTEPAQHLCPDGFHMLDGAKGRQQFQGKEKKGQCTKTVYTDKIPRCPAGTTQLAGESFVCATYVDKVASAHDKRVSIQHLCAEGYAEEGGAGKGKCTKRVAQPATPVCPAGTMLEGMSCAKSVPQSTSCPKGAVADKGRCWAYSTLEPIMVDTVYRAGGGGGKKGY